ncbi:NAD(P)/FAD-dependent oxidoreductase [Oxalobacteraceae bacterium R-40]|uniref:NAD(P)/FAD-dependent oxidoreductase n=1 Tax=Keguizhuia sedimenti TaxID=3064264 RepID=A0ABU1BRZ0_9BURK|nr:NAD(P)/FAD-dependent oxidoreductase [Oxalobacteraceae bacterium R-40]
MNSPATDTPAQTDLQAQRVVQTVGKPQKTEVLIIGGGPAGSTAAALLAEQGFHVTLLEKSVHPRFHIGESLLPANMPLLDKLGVREQVAAIGMPKWGVEFNAPEENKQTHIEFSEAWDKTMPYAYQVRRSDFDEVLFRNAQQKGAHAIEGCRVRDVQFSDDHATVKAQMPDGCMQEYLADFVIDASGRDTFLSSQFKTKEKNRKHNSSALYGHFTNAGRYEGKREGDISLYWFEHGWFWFIPLSDGTTSVGAVCWPYYLASRKVSVEQFFMDTIAMAPRLAARLKNATLINGVEATGNYSYTSRKSYSKRCILLGDAYAFVDPVFSSGVFLAMKSAFVGAEAVRACLREPTRAQKALDDFDRHMRKGPNIFTWFIYRVTNPAMRELFLHPQNVLRAKEGIMSVLAGDIFTNPKIWPSVYVFKGVYYLSSLFNPLRTLRAWQKRKFNIRDAV